MEISRTDAISISVCIPAYGRPTEYALLLKSIEQQTLMPSEVVICEDRSPERSELKTITSVFARNLSSKGVDVRFYENPTNLGYDGNLRQAITLASSQFVFFIGNDDYILPTGIEQAFAYLSREKVLAASRSFSRFSQNPLKPIGYSRIFPTDTIIQRGSHSAGTVLRIGGFFGGLIFDRVWAHQQATTRYDGTLFYQIYLLLQAYSKGTIGYISHPTVAARADNAPLFGSAKVEQGSFTPGRYSAKARGKMWDSILTIARDAELEAGIPIVKSIKQELSGKMSFHVFEMFVGRPHAELAELKSELKRLGLFNHWLPKCLYVINLVSGRHAAIFYRTLRRLIQRQS
jgi:glycosyltransferase involved in cell wall biosynthesis